MQWRILLPRQFVAKTSPLTNIWQEWCSYLVHVGFKACGCQLYRSEQSRHTRWMERLLLEAPRLWSQLSRRCERDERADRGRLEMGVDVVVEAPAYVGRA
jgi:hypothetical protein